MCEWNVEEDNGINLVLDSVILSSSSEKISDWWSFLTGHFEKVYEQFRTLESTGQDE